MASPSITLTTSSPSSPRVHAKSTWNEQDIIGFLDDMDIPIRLACNDSDGFPTVCSLWFYYDSGYIWCASHKNAHIIQALKKNAKCAFEVAPNDQPYRGVRGKGQVDLLTDDADKVLNRLIQRYLDSRNQALAQWLKSRSDDEVIIRISPSTLSSWDFTHRMSN